jgi:hypothetical protein
MDSMELSNQTCSAARNRSRSCSEPPGINTKICGRRGGDTNWSIRCMHVRDISLQSSWVAAILPDSVLDVPEPVLKNRLICSVCCRSWREKNFDKFPAFVAELEERRTPTNLQCLLWILKREELRQIYSVCCGSWREKNSDKSTVFIVELEERRTSTNLQCLLWILKREWTSTNLQCLM